MSKDLTDKIESLLYNLNNSDFYPKNKFEQDLKEIDDLTKEFIKGNSVGEIEQVYREEVEYLTQKQFDNLYEYSGSVPTGTTIGKRWKRNRNAYRILRVRRHFIFWKKKIPWEPDWYLGEYEEMSPPDPKNVNIKWRKIIIEERE